MPTKKCKRKGRCTKGGHKQIGSNYTRKGDQNILDQFIRQFPPNCWLLPTPNNCWLLPNGQPWLTP